MQAVLLHCNSNSKMLKENLSQEQLTSYNSDANKVKPFVTFQRPSKPVRSRTFQVQRCKGRSHLRGTAGNAALRRWSPNCGCYLHHAQKILSHLSNAIHDPTCWKEPERICTWKS